MTKTNMDSLQVKSKMYLLNSIKTHLHTLHQVNIELYLSTNQTTNTVFEFWNMYLILLNRSRIQSKSRRKCTRSSLPTTRFIFMSYLLKSCEAKILLTYFVLLAGSQVVIPTQVGPDPIRVTCMLFHFQKVLCTYFPNPN